MIQLYTWLTPNGRKISLMLEETGLSYEAIPVNIGRGKQHAAEFLRINPNGKVPVIVDADGPDGQAITIFESTAILLYLAQKSGKFLPASSDEYWRTLQWLVFQSANLGPMLGQAQHFFHYTGREHKYAPERYTTEARRLYTVLEQQLSRTTYLGGDNYTIADIATWPWIRPSKIQGITISEYPYLHAWRNRIEKRPAMIRERKVLAEYRQDQTSSAQNTLSAEARKHLFGRED